MGEIQQAINQALRTAKSGISGLVKEEEKAKLADERVQKRLDTLYAQRQKVQEQKAAVAQREQQITIGGQNIPFGNPLYKKVIEQMGGQNGN